MAQKKSTSKKEKSFPSLTIASWEPPKIQLTEEKAKMLTDLMKDNGIKDCINERLKGQVDAFMQGMKAAKKGDSK